MLALALAGGNDQLAGDVGHGHTPVARLRYLADSALRARVTAATDKVESYNGFSKWIGFGGVLTDNAPEEQEN
ncbi:hypothetical protein GCM10020216_106470 [Nonomuraea helvata]